MHFTKQIKADTKSHILYDFISVQYAEQAKGKERLIVARVCREKRVNTRFLLGAMRTLWNWIVVMVGSGIRCGDGCTNQC